MLMFLRCFSIEVLDLFLLTNAQCLLQRKMLVFRDCRIRTSRDKKANCYFLLLIET